MPHPLELILDRVVVGLLNLAILGKQLQLLLHCSNHGGRGTWLPQAHIVHGDASELHGPVPVQRATSSGQLPCCAVPRKTISNVPVCISAERHQMEDEENVMAHIAQDSTFVGPAAELPACAIAAEGAQTCCWTALMWNDPHLQTCSISLMGVLVSASAILKQAMAPLQHEAQPFASLLERKERREETSSQPTTQSSTPSAAALARCQRWSSALACWCVRLLSVAASALAAPKRSAVLTCAAHCPGGGGRAKPVELQWRTPSSPTP